LNRLRARLLLPNWERQVGEGNNNLKQIKINHKEGKSCFEKKKTLETGLIRRRNGGGETH